VVSAIETSVIGPYPASEVGRLKIPTPIMLPTISAIAAVSPNCGVPFPLDGSLAGRGASWGMST
jgi:hypothetical protein